LPEHFKLFFDAPLDYKAAGYPRLSDMFIGYSHVYDVTLKKGLIRISLRECFKGPVSPTLALTSSVPSSAITSLHRSPDAIPFMPIHLEINQCLAHHVKPLSPSHLPAVYQDLFQTPFDVKRHGYAKLSDVFRGYEDVYEFVKHKKGLCLTLKTSSSNGVLVSQPISQPPGQQPQRPQAQAQQQPTPPSQPLETGLAALSISSPPLPAPQVPLAHRHSKLSLLSPPFIPSQALLKQQNGTSQLSDGLSPISSGLSLSTTTSSSSWRDPAQLFFSNQLHSQFDSHDTVFFDYPKFFEPIPLGDDIEGFF
jgi:hypothetical protein